MMFRLRRPKRPVVHSRHGWPNRSWHIPALMGAVCLLLAASLALGVMELGTGDSAASVQEDALLESAQGEEESETEAGVSQAALREEAALSAASSAVESVPEESSQGAVDFAVSYYEEPQPITEEEAAAKLETANDLLAQLRASDDPEALFAQLADEYSEDPGRETNPTGYIYTPGTMVQIFEDTAAALAPGEISDVIQSDYGYHIILRKDLSQGFSDYPDQKRTLAEQHLQSIIQLEMAQAEVTRSEKLDDFDLGTFYEDYIARVEELLPEEETTGGDTTTGSTTNSGVSGSDAAGNSDTSGSDTANNSATNSGENG